jgi:SAM-dependent methyltransferase
VLDLGAGTGKLTRLLVATFGHVTAVEPAEPMRRALAPLCPAAEVRDGTGQQIPLPDRSVGAVFAAEAFHWFYDNDEQALAEMARVLRPDGSVVLMWNLPRRTLEPVDHACRTLATRALAAEGPRLRSLDLGGPRRLRGRWRGSLAAAGFEPIQSVRLPNPQILDRDGLVAFFASMGWIADLADDDRLPLLDEVRSRFTANRYHRLWETHVYLTELA